VLLLDESSSPDSDSGPSCSAPPSSLLSLDDVHPVTQPEVELLASVVSPPVVLLLVSSSVASVDSDIDTLSLELVLPLGVVPLVESSPVVLVLTPITR
jgi:hypothetical protein